jgi:hypothetical protein
MGERLSMSFNELVQKYNTIGFRLIDELATKIKRMTNKDVARWLVDIAVGAKAFIENQVPRYSGLVAIRVHDSSASIFADVVLEQYEKGRRENILEAVATFATRMVLAKMLYELSLYGRGVELLLFDYEKILTELARYPEKLAGGIVYFVSTVLDNIEWFKRHRE